MADNRSVPVSFTGFAACTLRVSRPLALVLALLSAAHAQPAFETLTRADGLPSDYVQSVYQDRYGFLWFGTDAGLARFDGRNVVVYTADDGLPDPFVYSIAEDGAGTLWVGTFSGVARWHGAGFEPVPTPLGDARVLYVSSGPGGHLIARTDRRSVLHRDGWQEIPMGVGTSWSGLAADGEESVISSHRLGATDDGPWAFERFFLDGRPPQRLAPPASVRVPRWISPAEGGLLFVSGQDGVVRGRFEGTRFVESDRFPEVGVRNVAEGAAGELYGIGDEGSWVWDRPGADPQAISPHRGQDLLVDREGGLWVGTFGHGVLRLAGRHVQRLTDDPVQRLTVAGSTVWATGRDGLVRVDARSLSLERSRSLSLRGLREVAWGGRGLMLSRGSDAVLRTRPARILLRDNNWVSGLDASTDTLWASGYGTGIVRRVAGVVLDTLGVGDGLGTGMVEGLARTSHGVWAITRSHGATLVRGRRLTPIRRASGLPSSAVYAVFEASDGSVWFGTDRGLGQWDGETVRAVGGEAFGQQRLLALFERAREPGVLYVLGERRLYRVAGERVQPLGRVLHGAAAQASINDAAYAASEDRLFLATTDGLVAVDLDRLPVPALRPQIALIGAQVDEQRREVAGSPVDGRLDLGPGPHRVEVRFASLLYASPSAVEYRVDGGAWRATGPEHRVVFSDLGAGEHRLEARALGPDGSRSEETARVTISVAPRWWERRGVQSLFVLLLLTAFGLAVRALSQRRLRDRVRRLELERQIQSERARISRDLHDHVGAQLSSLLAGVQLARLQRRTTSRDPEPAPADALDAVEADARETMQQLRETIWALHDDALTTDDFCDRLAAFGRRQTRGTDLRVTVASRSAAPVALPPQLALSLYRVAQEAVTNAVKHARARHIEATLAVTGDGVVLTVCDDGSFAGPAAGDGLTGFGMQSMRARAERLGGRFDLDTASGTTVRVSVPLPAPAAAAVPPPRMG